MIIDFKINQDFIAKVLCVNRNIPESTCNGKCHLKKQLKKTEESKDENLPPIRKEISELIFLIVEKTSINQLKNIQNRICRYTHKEGLYAFLLINSLFRPPEIIC